MKCYELWQGGAQMRGNHLFGIFSPEKLKKVIPPHLGGGITFSAFSALKSSKGDSRTGLRGPGRSPDAGESPFSAFSALKSSKR